MSAKPNRRESSPIRRGPAVRPTFCRLYLESSLLKWELMVVEIEGVALHLGHPDELTVNWVGQDEVMRQLLAAWLVIDPQDLPMNPRL